MIKQLACLGVASLDTRDKKNLDSIAGALVDVLNMLRRRTITPSTVAADSGTIDRDKGKDPGRTSLKIRFEMLEELRGLGIHSEFRGGQLTDE